MVTLTDDQEYDLDYCVKTVFSCATLADSLGEAERSLMMAKKGCYDMGAGPCWDDFTNASLAPLVKAVRQFFTEMELGNLDRYGVLVLGKDRVVSHLRTAITAPNDIGFLLLEMLSYQARRSVVSLRHYVDVGIALEELGKLDQNYGIVAPGIIALHSRWSWGLESAIDWNTNGVGVINTLKNTVARTFVPV
jgi:hypothetical protein